MFHRGCGDNMMTQVFSKEWFDRHQAKLVRFANSVVGRFVFGIPNVPVIGISPAGYSFIKGVNLKDKTLLCECRATTDAVYARRLRTYGAPVWWTAHFIDWLALDRQTLVPNFGFATLTKESAAGSSYCWDAHFIGATGDSTGVALATMRGTGGYWTVSATALNTSLGYIAAGVSAGYVTTLKRSGFLFDTTTIAKAALIYTATLNLTEAGVAASIKPWTTGDDNDLLFIPFAPASTSVPTYTDFNNYTALVRGTVSWVGTGSSGWNNVLSGGGNITLDTRIIEKADVTGIMSLFRGDMAGVAPIINSNNYCYHTVNSQDAPSGHPVLTVTYTYPIEINVGDSWKDVVSMKINVGDAWKEISDFDINISDVWKTVF